MNELANFWNIIVKSNTFNFAVLLLIFAILFKKLNVSALVEKIKQDIINSKPQGERKIMKKDRENGLLLAPCY